MWPIKIILHPTDFSDCSQEVFRVACALARDHAARLIVLHATAVPDLAYTGYGAPGSPLGAEQYLAKARQDLEKLQPPDPRLMLERRLEEGDPVTEILRVAVATDAEVIIMGTHGQTGFPHLLMGSVADRVLRKAPCPVLTLKTPHTGVPVAVCSFCAGVAM
jgi:nucleotide-binding universal stress UspA family protein